jgi:hypothetical protein
LVCRGAECTNKSFEYLIADMMHFTPSSLSNLAAGTGLEIKRLWMSWIASELSMTARPGLHIGTFLGQCVTRSQFRQYLLKQIHCLCRFVSAASRLMSTSISFRLFGTAIVATWLCSISGGNVALFVEEEASRVGHLHMDRPVVAPAPLKPGSAVFMAAVPQLQSKLPPECREIRL